MGLVTLPYVWVARELVPAAYLNADFNAILNQLNGNLDATNLANLAVTAAKLGNLAVTGPKIGMGSDAWGDVLFRGSVNYQRLAAGTSGFVLETLGNAADPVWVDPNTIGAITKVQSGSIIAGANFTISSLVAGAQYKLVLNGVLNTSAGIVQMQINADGGANYRWSGNVFTGSGSQAYGVGSNSDTSMGLTGTGAVVATDSFNADLLIQPAAATNNTALLIWLAGYGLAASYSAFHGCGKYSGAAPISSIKFAASAGTMTGSWSLYRLN
jgi:hypothetical protein